MDAGTAGAIGVFAFPAVGAIALFSFLAVASWSDARRKERESYYKNDMLKKLAEASGAGANAVMEVLREDARLRAVRKRQGLKVQGIMLLAVGLGTLIFLHALIRDAPIYLCGVLIMLMGAAMYGSSYLITAPE